MEFVFEHATMIAVIAVVVIILAILASGYVKAPPDTAFIISGFQKGQRILIGKAGIKLPFFERLDKLSLKLVAIDVKTSDAVPTADYINIQVDAAVNIKVGDEPQKLQKASQNFLNRDSEYIAKVAREVLEGNMREIVGKMRLEEMVSDRQKFAELVKENAEPDLAAMGLDIISFNVQNFVDSNQVIENLGIDNIVKIKKSAAIARANSELHEGVFTAPAGEFGSDKDVIWDMNPEGPWQSRKGIELEGKILGLIGFGTVGKQVAQRAKGFDLDVLVYDPYQSAEAIAAHGCTKVELNDLLSASDIISFHAKVTDANKNMISYEQFKLMKDGVFIVNTARAGLMDEEALRSTLRSGKLGGLALDVFHSEPVKRDDEYFNYPNVILTPHIAGAGRDVIYLQSVMLVNDLMLFLAGGKPRTIVDAAAYK